MKNDYDVVLSAIDKEPKSFLWASDKLKSDENVFTSIVNKYGDNLNE